MFLEVQQHDIKHEVVSEREAIAKYKVVGKSGKIPDMVINDWIIEYERTNKSTKDCQETINYWIYNQSKQLCVIYETEEIKNRYEKLITNQRVQLIASNNILKILQLISNGIQENYQNNTQNLQELNYNIKNENQAVNQITSINNQDQQQKPINYPPQFEKFDLNKFLYG